MSYEYYDENIKNFISVLNKISRKKFKRIRQRYD